MSKKFVCLFIAVFFIINSIISFAEEKPSGRDNSEKSIANIDVAPLLFVTSPDGRHVAYVAQIGDEQFVVIDGKKGKHYDGIGRAIVFSPDSKRVAYIAIIGKKGVVVVDGKEEKQYDNLGSNIIFSPDSRHVAYPAQSGNKQFVVIDGKEGIAL